MPVVSIIMPVHNGSDTLERAIASIREQEFPKWELIAVDDASDDGSFEHLQNWAERDRRIRALKCDENRGAGGARNQGLRVARGEYIAYLDCDDEYYSDYLEHVVHFMTKGDVLVFCFDHEVRGSETGLALLSRDPAIFHEQFFMANRAVTLGVSHRRSLLAEAGMFDERVWFQEDWDLWKRLARTGASVVFVPVKCGIYHWRDTSLSRSPRMSKTQRESLDRSRTGHTTLFPGNHRPQQRRPISKVAFASVYSTIDPASGAAVTTDDCLQLLARSGFECQAYAAARLGPGEEVPIEQTLTEMGMPYEVRKTEIEGRLAKMLFTRKGAVPITLFRNAFSQCGPVRWETSQFVAAYESFLQKTEPDVVVTYGGGMFGDAIIDLAKRRDIPVVFALHNLAYTDVRTFRHVDYVIVPSVFSREHYWEHLGLHCNVLPNVIDPERVTARERRPEYVTFVNPQISKGGFVFARIAEQIARRRPDIPMLVVESRDRARALEKTGLDLSWARNLHGMANSPDPRRFYGVTKVMLMPSVCEESFGLVAAESMLNGIPVLASNRGALPEIVGDGGLVLDIPARYTPASRLAPTAEEVEPWVEAIIRLWDDEEFYRHQSEKATGHAKRWHPEQLRPIYEQFFRNLQPQPGPPIVWRGGEETAKE